jgi:uncharacterized protein
MSRMNPFGLGSILLLISAAANGQTPSPTVATQPQIVTTGEGQSRITPDRATIYVSVQTRAATAAAAAAGNARLQKGVLDTLRSLGFGSDQLTTQNYSVVPEMQYDRAGGAPRVVGYSVLNTVRVEVRKIEEVGRAIDAALAMGANQISGPEFYASNIEGARRAALASAVTRAHADADAIARAAGGTVGQLIEVTSIAPAPQPVAFMMKAARESTPTPIEPGQELIQVTVTTRWLFVPAGR